MNVPSKVLVCDHIAEEGLKMLKEAGLSVDYRPKISPEELLSVVEDFDAVIVRSRTKIKSEVIQKAKNLKAIGRAGAGLDNIDQETAKVRGISVYNSPESLTNAVAELALGLIIASARGIGSGHYNLKNGKWVKDTIIGTELTGKTLGLVGFGRIGRKLAELVAPFKMKILVYDIVQFDPQILATSNARTVGIDELLASADFVSVHVPGGKGTSSMIDEGKLSLMKKTAYIINTSRGEVIDENALVNALKNGVIKGAALDVFSVEPPINKELLTLDNVVFTPHIGGQTVEAQISAATIVAEKIIKHFSP